jgi:hypothetical protein
MPFTAEKRREYDRARYASDAYKARERERSKGRRKPPRPFVGVDGEGGVIDGRHEYLLIRVGENVLYRQDSRPLRTVDILRWLTSLDSNAVHVGYGFDYDVSMILRDWATTPKGLEALRSLFDRESRKQKNGTYAPVMYQGFRVEYLPRKHFRVARAVADAKYFTVHDVIGFYQSSFVQALEAWQIGTPEERETIRAMKSQRSDFTTLTAEEIEYNRRECVLLAELVTALREATRDAGYAITSYEGAGCLAQAMLTKHDAPQKQELPGPVATAARAAYYGGRFEISRIGRVEPVHEYDLASAYPWAMSTLPCLEHGEWVNEYQPGNPIQVMRVAWAVDDSRPWGPYPFRDPDGTILYPSAGSGWYWYPEVAVEDRMRETNDVTDAWSFVRHCDHMPFTWIKDVFAERQRIGKSAKGKVLKLGLNSLYGKQAQSVGNPRFASPVYAGLITAKVRAIMADVCARYANDVVMIATDGIYLTREMKPTRDRRIIEAGDKAILGCWEHQHFNDLFLVKPGIYFTSDGLKARTRGVPRWQLEEKQAEIMEAWEREGLRGSVTVERTQFIGARAALAQNAPEKVGQWIPTTLSLAYSSNLSKRCFADDGLSVLWSRQGRLSTPYQKSFGMEIAAEQLWEDLDRLDY